jgi:hypothetical protein
LAGERGATEILAKRFGRRRYAHPRFTFHFTPTSVFWLNAVEGFFAKLTKQRLKRGVFHSLVSL